MPSTLQNPNPTLAETQTTLWRLITAPENVAEAPPFVEGSDTLPAVDRVNIYANMYFFRILDSLKEDFPELLHALGDDGFHNLIVQYLQAHPPTHYSLRYVGQHLAEFLSPPPRGRDRERGKASEHPLIRPAATFSRGRRNSEVNLSELARFEWAQLEAFDAADAPLLAEDDLKMIPAEKWPDLKFKLHPSVQLLNHNHTIVWRKELEVVHRTASPEEFAALRSLQSQQNFSELCAGKNPIQVIQWLTTWISQGLLAG